MSKIITENNKVPEHKIVLDLFNARLTEIKNEIFDLKFNIENKK